MTVILTYVLTILFIIFEYVLSTYEKEFAAKQNVV